jgi:cytochrome P450
MDALAPHPEPITVPLVALDRDPHAIFRAHRPSTPLLRREDGSYIAIRAADVERLMTDPRTRQMETESLRLRGIESGALFDFFKYSMLFTNARDHRRRRAPLSRLFAVQLIAAMRPQIRAVATQLIERCQAREQMSFLEEFCAPLPARMICALLGVPESDVPRFTSWVYRVARAIGGSFTRDDVPDIEDAARQLTSYVSDLLASRHASPQQDFLTQFVRSVEEEGTLSAIEAVIQIVTVILGGSDTTRTAMAVQVSLLLQEPERWQAVRSDPTLIPGAVSEALRFEPAVASVPRVTLQEIQVEDFVLPPGRMVSLSTLSAMRDPARYGDPDRFDIHRTDLSTRHPVFGGGPHRCLGEALARAELEEGLAALLERLPHLRLVGEPPQLQGHSGIRRISSMQVAWS